MSLLLLVIKFNWLKSILLAKVELAYFLINRNVIESNKDWQGIATMNHKLINTHMSDNGFSIENLPTEKPMVVEFNATWSGPCHIMEPVLESAAGIYGHKINFHRVDIDDFPEITRHFGVRKVPTILIFNRGSLVDFAVGAISRGDLASKLDKVL